MNYLGEQTMSLVKVRQRGQVTLPQDVRDQLQLEEGNYLEASVENHAIVLKPKVMVDRIEKGKRSRGSVPSGSWSLCYRFIFQFKVMPM
jgi:AbrB family looped-hinge helix DNA binding protein